MRFTSVAVAASENWRDVRLAAVARAVSLAGDLLAATALVLALQQRGDSGFGVAAVLLASTVPMMALAPVGGRIADRFDSRTVLTVVGLAQAACALALAFVQHPVALVALVALLASGLAVSQPTFSALVPSMIGRDSLPKAMALMQTATSIGMIGGPALAGFLVQGVGLRVPLLLNALTYLAVVVAGLMIRTRRGAATGPSASEPTAPPWRFRQDALLARIVPVTAITVGAISVVNVVLVFFIRDTLGASAAAYGLADAVFMIGLIAGAWAVARRSFQDRGLTAALLVALAGMGAMFALASAVPSVLWLIPIYLVSGGFNGGMNTTAQVLIARRVPAAARGRAFGTWVGVANGAVAVGYLAAGPLMQVLTPRQCVLAAGLTGLVAVAALAVPILRAARRDAAAPAPVPVAAAV